MRKRIGIFIAEISTEYQKVVLQAMSRKANSLGYDVFAFCTFGSYGTNLLHAEGERKTIYLPIYDQLDGIVVADDTFDVEGMGKELRGVLQEQAKCPVVYIRYPSDVFPSVMIHDKTAMADMVRHFVKDHGFRDVCFMTGKMENKAAQDRLAAFEEVMAEENIPITEHMVFYGDFWRDKGKEAVDWFTEGRDTYPQAIICSNDYMAVAVCEELKKRNVRVPEDICVSGFDNVWEAETYVPSLTTVGIPFVKLAEETIEVVDALRKGEERDRISWVKSDIKLRRSCGCGKQEQILDWAYMVDQIYTQNDDIKRIIDMITDFQDTYEEREYMFVAERYFKKTLCQKGYLCLCDGNDFQYSQAEEKTPFSEKMCLKRIFSIDQKGIPCEEYFDRGMLLPEHILGDTPQSFLIISIHFKNQCYGYLALQPQENNWIGPYTQAYAMSLANAIEDAVMHHEVTGLEEIRKLYQKDVLTGIYNRRGYERQLRPIYESLTYEEKYMSIVSVDMDGLKYINDHYGHAEGDEALQRIARVLEELTQQGEICARLGGDEFAMVLLSDSRERHRKFKLLFREAMEKENARIKKPYPLQASIGICCVNEEPGSSLATCIRKADKRMYLQKRSAKRRREDMNP